MHDPVPVDPASPGSIPAIWIDSAPVAIIIADRASRILAANRNACDLFRRTAAEMQGLQIEDLIPSAFRPGHQRHVEGFFAAMAPRTMGAGREVRAIDAAGREFPVEIGLSPLLTPDGPQVIAAIVDITERRRRERESTLARLVQDAMLPGIPDPLPGLEIAARSVPADSTGGDLYDIIRFDDGRTGLVISDASGHGFAAALVSAIARSYLRALTLAEPGLAEVLRKANDLLVEDDLESRFVTLMFIVFDPRTMHVSCAAAGHVGYLLAEDGTVKQRLEGEGPPLGYCAGAGYSVSSFPVEAGDLIVLLTDGIEEAMDPAGDLFGRTRALELVRRASSLPVSEIVDALYREVRDFTGNAPPGDDATAVIARVRP